MHDGDETTGLVPIDAKSAERMRVMEPHLDIHNPSEPGTFSNSTNLTKEIVDRISAFIDEGEWAF